MDLNSASSGVSAIIVAEIVKEVLEQHPRLAHKLAYTRDANNRTVLSIAQPEVVAEFYKYLFYCGRYEVFSGPPLHRSATAVLFYARDHGVVRDYELIFKKYANATSGVLDRPLFCECICDLQWTKSALNDSTINREAGQEVLNATFDKCDTRKSGTVSVDAFVSFCCAEYGRCRKVVLKFMNNEVC